MLGQYLARDAGRGRGSRVLCENNSYGQELLAGLRRGVRGSKVKLVAAQGYEVTATDVQSQVAKLKASGANVFADLRDARSSRSRR